MKKIVLFDLDGTLTDPKEGIIKCLQYALERSGEHVPETEELLWCIGPPLHESFAKLAPKQDPSRLVDLYRERYKPVGQFENKMYEGIMDLLSHLKLSKTLFIATSKAEPFAKTIAEHFGFHSHFKRVHGCEMDGTRSDKVELIQHIIKLEGFSPSDAVMIGDRKHDIRGGRLNGLTTIGVTWGYGSRAEHVEAGADHIIETVAELRALLCQAETQGG